MVACIYAESQCKMSSYYIKAIASSVFQEFGDLCSLCTQIPRNMKLI